MPPRREQTALLALLALTAFAANSLLCRTALRPGLIDAASFTGVRLGAGALTLGLLTARRRARGGDGRSALALLAYAAPFSFAYLRLGAGEGALVLFGAVQTTMLGWGLARGERPGAAEWLGLALAVAGLIVLTAPGASAPDPLGAALMALAGASWGVYSLRGRGGGDPLAATAGNFLRAAPLAGALVVASALTGPLHVAPRGVLLAALSGALASGLGYAIWYAALRGLTATRAAILQLAVPVLAAAGGVLWLDERITARAALASAAILGGVALAVLRRAPPPPANAAR
ncbi:MAG: DMT family transporter [Kofleriaceae bacterium]